MPYTEKQIHTAEAIAHGWHPSQGAIHMSPGFARKVVAERKAGVPIRPPVRKTKGRKGKRKVHGKA